MAIRLALKKCMLSSALDGGVRGLDPVIAQRESGVCCPVGVMRQVFRGLIGYKPCHRTDHNSNSSISQTLVLK